MRLEQKSHEGRHRCLRVLLLYSLPLPQQLLQERQKSSSEASATCIWSSSREEEVRTQARTDASDVRRRQGEPRKLVDDCSHVILTGYIVVEGSSGAVTEM